VKQQLAAVRMLFDWLIIGQVAPSNTASAVRGPTHVVKTGTTPVLEGKEWRRLIDAIPTDTVRDLRDRALIATLTYGFARIGAALKMRVEDLPIGGLWLADPAARERRQAALNARGLFVRRSRSTAGGRGHGGQYRDGDAGGERGTARQTAGSGARGQEGAAGRGCGCDGRSRGTSVQKGFDRPEQSSSRSTRNRRPPQWRWPPGS
jgi:integrase